jgi:hypothetical protein
VRSWAKAARRWPAGTQRELLDAYDGPVGVARELLAFCG